MDMSMRERIQEAAEQDAVVIGREESLKEIDSLETIVLAMNTPAALEAEVTDAATEHSVDVETLDVDNEELGSLCMKPFTASVVGLQQ